MMLTIGQKLWFVPRERYNGAPYEVEITKVGRKWAQTIGRRSDYRVNVDTLAMDSQGYGIVGQCYTDRDAYEAESQRQLRWDRLKSTLSGWSVKLHRDVTIEDMDAAAKLLRLNQ